MNAGCSYLNKGERERNKLLHHYKLYSEFSDHTDSTVATSSCPYDRWVEFITRTHARTHALAATQAGTRTQT